MELVFESRKEIVARRGRLTPYVAGASVDPAPVLRPETGYDGGGVALYGSVLPVDGGLRMYYQAAPRNHPWDRDFSYVATAVSDDGLRWKREKGNPTNLGLHSPSVLSTAGGYLATGCIKRSAGLHDPSCPPGYYQATSVEGLDWQLCPQAGILPGADVITSHWDERFGRGEAALKWLRFHGGMQRRCLAFAPLGYEVWGEPALGLVPETEADLAARLRGKASADYYGMTWLPAGERSMVGLVWVFWHEPPFFRSGAGMFGGASLVPFFREAPGEIWMPPPGFASFLEHPEGAASGKFFYAASSVLTMEREQVLYCTAFHRGHGFSLNEERKKDPAAIGILQKESLASIHRAAWPKDRIFGLRAGTESDLVLLVNLPEREATLRINHNSGHHGSIRARLSSPGDQPFVAGFSPLPAEALPGYDFEDCTPLLGDELSAVVRWRGKKELPSEFRSRPVLLTLRLLDSSLFAYEIS